MNRSGMTLAILLATAAALAGDEIRLKSGGRLEGIVREERSDVVVFETAAGTVTIPRREIESVDRSVRSPLQEYYDRETKAQTAEELISLAEWAAENKMSRFVKGLQERGAAIARREFVDQAAALGEDASADSLYRLGTWARRHGLSREGRDLLERALLRDPEHEAARRSLGFKRFEGRWLTEEEVMLAKGFVQFEGRWVTENEKDLILRERAARLKERERQIREDEERLQREKAKLEARESDVGARERSAATRERDLAREREELQDLQRRARDLERDFNARDLALTRLFGDYRLIVVCSTCRIWWTRAVHSSCPFCAFKKDAK